VVLPARRALIKGEPDLAESVLLENIFSKIPDHFPQELVEILVQTNHFHLERLVSGGQATPPGQWYDQETHEWVVLLSGAAGLLFEGESEILMLTPGDYLLIPAHRRHRVAWTDPHHKTVWLALHYH
jgi:cupin 2 domain-containing protein